MTFLDLDNSLTFDTRFELPNSLWFTIVSSFRLLQTNYYLLKTCSVFIVLHCVHTQCAEKPRGPWMFIWQQTKCLFCNVWNVYRKNKFTPRSHSFWNWKNIFHHIQNVTKVCKDSFFLSPLHTLYWALGGEQLEQLHFLVCDRFQNWTFMLRPPAMAEIKLLKVFH